MKRLIVPIMLLSLLLPSIFIHAEECLGCKEVERELNAYMLSDAILSARVETKLNVVIGILAPIGLGALTLLGGAIKKHFKLTILGFIIAGILSFAIATYTDKAECSTFCKSDYCRISADCGDTCNCIPAGGAYRCMPLRPQ